MKVKKIILAILLATSISLTFLVGCESSTIDNDKKVYTTTEVSKIKKNLSKKISKAIEDNSDLLETFEEEKISKLDDLYELENTNQTFDLDELDEEELEYD